MTATNEIRACFADCGPEERAAAVRAFVKLRDDYALGDHLDRALAQVFSIVAGAAADAGNGDAEELKALERAYKGHGPRGGYREAQP